MTDEDSQDVNANGDSGEWWGLQYTLELSRRDSRASDTSSSTTGEHSKVCTLSFFICTLLGYSFYYMSRVANHGLQFTRGRFPPLYEDTNFQDWKRWHRGLEKAELRRRRKRTIDFIEESTHLSSLYIDENLAQRAVHIFVSLDQNILCARRTDLHHIQTDMLTPGEIYDALLWIEYAAERRPVRSHSYLNVQRLLT